MEALWPLTLMLAPIVGVLVALRRARATAAPPDLVTGLPRLHGTEGLSDGQRVALVGTLCHQRSSEEPEPVAVTATLASGRVVRGAVDGLRLTLASGDIALNGAIHVHLAPRLAPPWNSLGALEERVLASVAVYSGRSQREVRDSARAVRVLVTGDRVLAVGRVRIEAAPQPGGAYREATTCAVLLADDDGAITLIGDAPPRTPQIARAAATGAVVAPLLVAIAWTLVGYVALVLGDGEARTTLQGARSYLQSRTRPGVVSLARVSPVTRARAHDALMRAWRYRASHTEETFQASLREAKAAGACREALDIAEERAHPGAGVAMLRGAACRSWAEGEEGWRSAQTLYAAGLLSEASERFAPSRVAYIDIVASYVDSPAFDLRMHLLAADFATAERVARRRAAATASREVAQALTCVADRLVVERRDNHDAPSADSVVTAAAALERAAATHNDCALLYADMLRDDARRQYIAGHGWGVRAYVAEALAREADYVPPGVLACAGDWSALLFDAEGSMAQRVPALEVALHARLPYDDTDATSDDWRRARVHTACAAASWYAMMGDASAADEALTRAREFVRDLGRRQPRAWHTGALDGIAALRAVAAIMRGDDALAARERSFDSANGWRETRIDAVIMLRAGTAAVPREFAEGLGADDARVGWRMVARGDGQGMLSNLDATAWRGLGAWIVYGAPRLSGVRRALADWLAWNAPPPCITCSTRQRFAALRARQIAARAWGLPDDDHEAIEALAAALTRRRGAVALMVVDALAERRTW